MLVEKVRQSLLNSHNSVSLFFLTCVDQVRVGSQSSNFVLSIAGHISCLQLVLNYASPCLGTDYCTTIEGDECCSCWDAYFELNKLEVRANYPSVNRYLKSSRVSPGLIQLFTARAAQRGNLKDGEGLRG